MMASDLETSSMVKKISYVSSEVYQQIRPSQLEDIKRRIEVCGSSSMYPFKTNGKPPVRRKVSMPEEIEVIEAYQISFSNMQVLSLLQKASMIVENTEEGIKHTLTKLFLNEDNVKGIPPGTLRFYSQKLICFYTGKNWRKITL